MLKVEMVFEFKIMNGVFSLQADWCFFELGYHVFFPIPPKLVDAMNIISKKIQFPLKGVLGVKGVLGPRARTSFKGNFVRNYDKFNSNSYLPEKNMWVCLRMRCPFRP
jgi:hypothetical protein